MKKFYMILGLLAFTCFSYSQDVLEFTLKKPLGNESSIYFHVKGLNNDEVLTSQKLYGYNSIKANHKNSWYILLFDILKNQCCFC